MRRKDFLRGFGLAGVGAVLPVRGMTASRSTLSGPMPPNCTLIPSETAGPFPLDLTENQTFFRQDVREDRTGTRHDLKLKIIGEDNCLPMPNVRVNIWHCDKDGNYSGYGTQTGLTYLRGYQWTDANGECEFITVFPGWYPGRICHIHFQVWVSSVYAAISQLTYPIAEKQAIYAANAGEYTKGADPLSFNQDGIFADGYAYQLASLADEPDPETGSYTSYLEITVKGSGISTGLAYAEPETGGQFKLYQNFPNPYLHQTTIPFDMIHSGDAFLELWDLSGKKRTELSLKGLSPGSYKFYIDPLRLGIPTTNYVYQLRVENASGIFRQAKMMTTITK